MLPRPLERSSVWGAGVTGPGGGPPQVVVPGAGWVDVASRVIVQVGFPVVVAGVLLWFLLTKFEGNLGAIVERMAANTEAAARLVETQRAELLELQAQSGELRAQTLALKSLEESGAKMLAIQEERQRM